MHNNRSIVLSALFACMIVLASYVNIIGAQTEKSLNSKTLKSEVDQEELFQTVSDLVDNREIQKTLTRRRYLEIEEKMRNFAERMKIPLEELDLLFWSFETGRVLK